MPRLLLAVALLTALTAPAQADPIVYADGFEAAALNPFWTTRTESGSISLVSNPVHGGGQAVQFSSFVSGINKNIHLSHTFAAPVYGTASVWVFDTGADQSSSNYLTLQLENRGQGTQRVIIGYDYDLGPTNGGNYYIGSGTDNSGVDRTPGWHLFAIETTPDLTRFSIDGVVVRTDPTGFAFDHLRVGMFGPSWRPAWQGQFDDFSFREFQPTAVPEPAAGLVFGGLLAAGLTVLRRRAW